MALCRLLKMQEFSASAGPHVSQRSCRSATLPMLRGLLRAVMALRTVDPGGITPIATVRTLSFEDRQEHFGLMSFCDPKPSWVLLIGCDERLASADAGVVFTMPKLRMPVCVKQIYGNWMLSLLLGARGHRLWKEHLQRVLCIFLCCQP